MNVPLAPDGKPKIEPLSWNWTDEGIVTVWRSSQDADRFVALMLSLMPISAIDSLEIHGSRVIQRWPR